MDQMTEGDPRLSEDPSAFYDRLAPDYDAMTGFENRFVREAPAFQQLVRGYAIRTALDAGCGTGFHALLLAKLGVQVTAVDVSGEMLRALEAHKKSLRLDVEPVQSSFQTLSVSVRKTFDCVFCLGNSLAHLLGPDDLRLSLSNFFLLLRPGGTLILQHLNYDRILKRRDRVQSVKEQNGLTFVRFLDFDRAPDLIGFNILILERKGGSLSHRLSSITLRPVLRDEFSAALDSVGFVDVRFFGSIAMEEFKPESSTDLVVTAEKPTTQG